MKLTKNRLNQIIQEEYNRMLQEGLKVVPRAKQQEMPAGEEEELELTMTPEEAALAYHSYDYGGHPADIASRELGLPTPTGVRARRGLGVHDQTGPRRSRTVQLTKSGALVYPPGHSQHGKPLSDTDIKDWQD